MFKRLATGLHTAKVSFVMRSTVSQKWNNSILSNTKLKKCCLNYFKSIDKTEEEEEAEMESMRIELENEKKMTEDAAKITRELEKRSVRPCILDDESDRRFLNIPSKKVLILTTGLTISSRLKRINVSAWPSLN